MNPRALSAYAQLDANTIALSGTVQLTLTIEGPAPLRVETPREWFQPLTLQLWQVAPIAPAQVTELAEGQQQWQQSFRLDPFERGELQILVVPVQVRAAENAPAEVNFGPLSVQVKTLIGKVELAALHPGTTIEPAPVSERTLPLWPGIIALLGLVLGFAIWVRWRRQQPVPTLWEQRAQELDAVVKLAPADAAMQLSMLMRQWLEADTPLPATRRTTPELIALAAPASPVELLRECDAARFTGQAISSEQVREWVGAAREWLWQLREFRESAKTSEDA